MGDDITIGVTEIVNNIEVTAQPNDQIIDIDVVDNSDDVTLNITPTVVEININKGSSFARWGTILGNLPDQADLQNVLNLKADLVGGLVPASQLPSYVDDIVEVANYAALPVVGETGKIYLTLDNNKIFRWSGSVYIEIAANNAIWGAITGTLSSQTDLQTALDTKALKTTTITINGTSYDLSANRSWTIPTHDAVTIGTANGLYLIGQELSLGLASSINTGALSAGNWATFNSKIGGSGTTNYIPKFTSSSAIGNSLLYDNGTNVFVGGSGSNDYRFNVVEGATLNGQQILMQNVSSSKEALHIVHIGTGNLIKGTKASAVEVFNVTNSGGAYFAGSVGIGNTNPTVAKLQVKGENGKYAGYLYNTSGVAGQTNGLIIEGGTNTLDYSLVVNSSAGLPYFHVRGDGKVGIGKSDPTQKLDVDGSISASSLILSGGTAGTGLYYGHTNKVVLANYTVGGGIDFETNGGAINMVLNSDGDLSVVGKVGIGTTNPAQNLHVVGNGLVEGVILYRNGSTNILNIGGDQNMYGGTNSDGGVFVYGNNKLHLSTNSVRRLTVDGSGNVGIGTTSPAYKLQVNKSESGSSPSAVLRLENTGANYTSKLTLTDGTTNDANISYLGATQSLGFGVGISLNQMVLTSTGNVGIGTTSPSSKLSLYDTSDLWLNISRGSNFLNLGLDLTGVFYNTNTNHRFLYNSGANEAMRITSGGNVGIGTESPSYQLQLSTDSAAKPTSALWTIASDERIKENINSYTKGLNELLKINPITYDYNGLGGFKKGKGGVGIIAQEIAEILPDSVSSIKAKLNETDEEEIDILNFNGHELTYILINAVKELKAEIEILKNK